MWLPIPRQVKKPKRTYGVDDGYLWKRWTNLWEQKRSEAPANHLKCDCDSNPESEVNVVKKKQMTERRKMMIESEGGRRSYCDVRESHPAAQKWKKVRNENKEMRLKIGNAIVRMVEEKENTFGRDKNKSGRISNWLCDTSIHLKWQRRLISSGKYTKLLLEISRYVKFTWRPISGESCDIFSEFNTKRRKRSSHLVTKLDEVMRLLAFGGGGGEEEEAPKMKEEEMEGREWKEESGEGEEEGAWKNEGDVDEVEKGRRWEDDAWEEREGRRGFPERRRVWKERKWTADIWRRGGWIIVR
jgi:hypothetical protein